MFLRKKGKKNCCFRSGSETTNCGTHKVLLRPEDEPTTRCTTVQPPRQSCSRLHVKRLYVITK